jgi:Zn-dependent protease
MQYLLYAIAVYLLLVSAPYIITFLRFCKITIQYPRYEVEVDNQVPVYIQELFASVIAELAKFEFQLCSYLQVEQMVKLEPIKVWEILLHNRLLKTYAKVAIRLPVEPTYLFDIEFYTLFKDGSLLHTMNDKAYSILGEVPNVIIQDAYTPYTSVQWQVHQDKLQQLAIKKTSCAVSSEDFGKLLLRYTKKYIHSSVKTGMLCQIRGTRLFHFSWLAALKITPKMIRGGNKTAAILRQRQLEAKSDTSINVEIPVELEMESFKRMEDLQKELLSGKLGTGLLLLSLVLFITSYIKILSPHSFLIFFAALLFHEGGHLLAMKLCGYQNPSLLFLPFFGAVTSGRKDDATVAQKFWVALAGPLPGLIMGIGLAMINRGGEYPGWVSQASWTLIILNLSNLLPIYPLDGGQIAGLLLFYRFPYTDMLFKVFGAISLGILGISRQPVMLIFALLVGLTIPHSFRSAKVNIKLQKAIRGKPPSSQNNLLHYIFEYLKQSEYKNLSFSLRYSLAKDLIKHHYISRGNRLTRISLVILYCGSLLGGMIGSLSQLVSLSTLK